MIAQHYPVCKGNAGVEGFMSPRKSFEELARINVANLVDYAVKYLHMDDADVIYATNTLLDMMGLTEPVEEPAAKYDFYETLSALSAYAVRRGICREEDRLLFETRIMGALTPPPSKVIETFDNIAAQSGSMKAAEWLGDLSERSAYIRRPDIDRNVQWEYDNPRGKIVITINLAKPEKTPEEVRRAKEAKTGYPKCMLCAENVGFAGNAAHPARQTLRTIPFELDGEEWFLQFSPYVYFEQHVIAISREHRPMNVNAATFRRMLDFVDLFPGYFIGSNAALPIVGGSILAHDHYQGGKKVLPIFASGARRRYLMKDFPDVNVSVAEWYNSVVRLESKNRAQLLDAAEKFRSAWEHYSDEGADIICCTENADGTSTPHNAVTPTACFNDDGEYQINLILRNNRTDEKHPYGIFHPAEELHNIKQEAIGIIEVQGLFILPGRLQRECEQIKDLLTGKTPLDFKSIAEDGHPLNKHLGMIAQLVADGGTEMSDEKAGDAITAYINTACEKILDTTAVFKNTEDGQARFDKFIRSVIE